MASKLFQFDLRPLYTYLSVICIGSSLSLHKECMHTRSSSSHFVRFWASQPIYINLLNQYILYIVNQSVFNEQNRQNQAVLLHELCMRARTKFYKILQGWPRFCFHIYHFLGLASHSWSLLNLILYLNNSNTSIHKNTNAELCNEEGCWMPALLFCCYQLMHQFSMFLPVFPKLI